MKKILATMLALVMALTLCSTAWAEGAVTLKVDGTVTTSATARADGAEFDTVQKAIDVAQAGDTIQIAAGTYAAFHVDKALTFIGSGDSTVIETMKEANDSTCGDCISTTGAGYVAKSIIIHLNGGSVTIKNMTITSAGSVADCKWYEAPIATSAHATGICPDSVTVENCSISYTGAEGGHNNQAICTTVANLTVKNCVISGFKVGVNLLNDGVAFGTVAITGNDISARESAVSAYSGVAATGGNGAVTVTGNTFTGTGTEPAQMILHDYANQSGDTMFGNLNIGNNTLNNAETVILASDGDIDHKIINPEVANGNLTSGIFNFNPVDEGVTLGGVDLDADPVLASSTNGDDETNYYFGAQNITNAANENGNIKIVRGGNEVVNVPDGTEVTVGGGIDNIQVNGNNMSAGDTATFYTVIFDSNGGTAVESVVVKGGDKITEPAAPTNGSKRFGGWYNGDTKWNFAQDTVNSSMTLTAKWSTRVKLDTTTTTTDTTPKAESPKTFDAGIAVYGVMAVSSVLGMGYVGKKKF